MINLRNAAMGWGTESFTKSYRQPGISNYTESECLHIWRSHKGVGETQGFPRYPWKFLE